MKNVLMIALLILMLGSCKKNTTVTLSTKDTSGIVGNWKWIETNNYYLPPSDSNPLTPKYTGYQEIVSFNADHIYIITKSNTLIDSGTYTHGHNEFVDTLFNQKYIYDSILYYHKGIPIKDKIDFYQIFTDTLYFDVGFRGIIGTVTTKTWKKQ